MCVQFPAPPFFHWQFISKKVIVCPPIAYTREKIEFSALTLLWFEKLYELAL